MINQIERGTFVSSLIGLYAVRGLVAKKVIRDPNLLLKYYTNSVSKRSKAVLAKLKFEVHVKNYNAELLAKENFLLVGNHMSYLDILVISSIVPCGDSPSR